MPQPVTERVIVATPTRIGRSLVAPIQLQLTASDQLRINYKSSVSVGVFRLRIQYRIIAANGDLVSGQELVPMTGDGQLHSVACQLREGYRLGLTLSVDAGSKFGQVFVQAYVFALQGAGGVSGVAVDQILAPLVQGFVSMTNLLTWPGSAGQEAGEAPWYDIDLSITTPAAGAEFILNASTTVDWRIVSITATFQSDAVVATRFPGLRFINRSAATAWHSARHPGVTATQKFVITWFPGATHVNSTVADNWVAECPQDLLIDTGTVLQSDTLFIDPGDQWSTITARAKERLRFT